MDLITLTIAAGSTLAAYYFWVASKKVRIHCNNVTLRGFVAGIPILREKFYPSPLYVHGLLQTIFGISKRVVPKIEYERHVFTLSDGGEIALDFKISECKHGETDTLAVIMPGLMSTSQSPYIRTMVLACLEAGTSVLVINYRGHAGIPLKTCRGYCASKIGDYKEVMDYVHAKYPEKRKVAIGASLGAIIVGQYLIQHPKDAKEILRCAFLVCASWDVHASTKSTERPIIKQLLNRPLALSCGQYMKKYRNVLETRWDVDEIARRSLTIRDFDINVTTKQFGYSTVEDYYDDASLSGKTDRFTIPVFALNSEDDPMVPGNALPIQEAETKDSNLVFLVTARGGHLGFLEGLFPTKQKLHFVDRLIKDFLIRLKTHAINTST